MMERICPHGVGHPDPDDLEYKRKQGLPDAAGIHGCCGCCNESIFLSYVKEGLIIKKITPILDESGFSSGAGVTENKWVLADE
jgi:hypothetical protein